MPHHRGVLGNQLLANLPAIDYEGVGPHLQPFALRQGFAFDACAAFEGYLCFIDGGIVATSSLLEDGNITTVALVGREGVVGIPLLLGASTGHGRATVISAAAHGWLLPVDLVRNEPHGLAALRRLLLAYTQALMAQIALGAGCNRHHSLEQRLCRCILACMDRLSGNDFAVTHQAIAHMLGVRRESVTEALGRLEEGGLVHCARGSVAMLDRPGMEARACECYGAVRSAYGRLLHAQQRGDADRRLAA